MYTPNGLAVVKLLIRPSGHPHKIQPNNPKLLHNHNPLVLQKAKIEEAHLETPSVVRDSPPRRLSHVLPTHHK